jgi:hypothetical protein
MKKLLLILLCFVFIGSSKEDKPNIIKIKLSDLIDERKYIYVPKDLYDCFNELNKIIPDSLIIQIKTKSENKFVSDAHFELGLWIRNMWIRNDDTTLCNYFTKLGINAIDDMSSIILVSYHRYLTDC